MARERRFLKMIPDPKGDPNDRVAIELGIGNLALFERKAGTGSIDTPKIKGKRVNRGRIWLTNELGVRKRRIVYGSSPEDVDRKMSALKHNPYASTKSLTIAKQCEWFTKKQEQKGTRASTLARDETCIRVHILPHLGTVNFFKLTTENVLAFLEKLKGNGVGRPMRERVRIVLQHIYNLALADDVLSKTLTRNPVTFAKIPFETPKKPKHILSQEETNKLLVVAEDTRWSALIYLLFVTGLRIGEASGLVVEALHLEGKEKYLEAYQAIARGKKGKLFLSPMKNNHSMRRLYLDEGAVRVLKAEIEGKSPSDLVFPSSTGNLFNACNFVGRVLPRLCKQAGVPRVTTQSFRHVAHSEILAEGHTSLVDLSKRLGHSSPRVTLAVYSHSVPGKQQEIARQAEALFHAPSEKANPENGG